MTKLPCKSVLIQIARHFHIFGSMFIILSINRFIRELKFHDANGTDSNCAAIFCLTFGVQKYQAANECKANIYMNHVHRLLVLVIISTNVIRSKIFHLPGVGQTSVTESGQDLLHAG